MTDSLGLPTPFPVGCSLHSPASFPTSWHLAAPEVCVIYQAAFAKNKFIAELMPLSPIPEPLCMCPEDEARASVRETQSTGLPTHCLMLCCVPQNLTYEIILTLGQAFEVAYQLALQAQKSRPLGASAADTIETKSSKPVPKPRATSRKSTVREPACVGWSQTEGRGGLLTLRTGLVSTLLPWPRGHAGCREPPVMLPCVCLLCSAPRCRRPLIVAVVTVTRAPPTVLPTYRCRLLVPESRSSLLSVSVCLSPVPWAHRTPFPFCLCFSPFLHCPFSRGGTSQTPTPFCSQHIWG